MEKKIKRTREGNFIVKVFKHLTIHFIVYLYKKLQIISLTSKLTAILLTSIQKHVMQKVNQLFNP